MRASSQRIQTFASPGGLKEHLANMEAFFDRYAGEVHRRQLANAGYHGALASLARFYIPKGARVLEAGSGAGDLLAALAPSRGVGIDISAQMAGLAAANHPDLTFRKMAAEELETDGEKFDFILLSDLIGYLYDVRQVFVKLREACHARTRVVMHWHSRVWQPLLWLAEKLGRRHPQPPINWTTPEDVTNMLNLAGFEVVNYRRHILLPVRFPVLTTLANRYLAHLPVFRSLCLTNWIVARPLALQHGESSPVVSVICPCRNEAGNILSVVERLPSLGARTELVFVEGHSQDGTFEKCMDAAAAYGTKDIKVLRQTGKGKGDAVRLGFSAASGDILAILDADLGVAPEDLPQFFDALASGKAEFLNGSRLVYPMDPEAMRFLNLLGNKFFAMVFRFVLGHPLKDTLCGTKALWRSDYERIAANRAYFGELDPYGDFDLLLGAAKLNLKIVEIPIRYRQRTYGETNISRFRDALLLFRMVGRATAKLLFIE